jgi:signal transduction histidine kinase
VRVALYRVAQEALHNVAKHAGASRCDVYLRRRATEVELRIVDDGVGFDPHAVTAEHLGLRIMRERVEAVGATLSVESRPQGGTAVGVHWQIAAMGQLADAPPATVPALLGQPAGLLASVN